MTLYLFDMDGILTPARKPMQDEFAAKFLPWLEPNLAYIATGSDFAKVKEQIPNDVINAFTGIFCAMGNDLWQKGKFTYHIDFTPEDELIDELEFC